MALINYPQQQSNLWAQNVSRGDNNQAINSAMYFDTQRKIQAQAQMQDILKEIDPIAFVSDRNQLEQKSRIGQISEYVTSLAKERRGRYTEEDFMNIQFHVKKLQTWQAQEAAELKLFATEYEAFVKNPEKYDHDKAMAGFASYLVDGDIPPGGFLELRGKNAQEYFSKMQPYKGYESTLFTNKDGKDIKVTTKQYGLPLPDGKGIDPGATMNDKKVLIAQHLSGDQLLKKGASKDFMAQPMEVQKAYAKRAQEYNDGPDAKKKGMPSSVDPVTLWAMDNYTRYIQPAEGSYIESGEPPGMRTAQYNEGQKGEKEGTSLKKTLAIEGDNVSVDGVIKTVAGKDNEFEETMSATYNPSKIETINNIPKGSKYLIDGKTFLLTVPYNWAESENGSFASDVPKSALNRSLTVDKAFIDYDVPVYIGASDIDVKYKGNKFFFKPGQPVSGIGESALGIYAKENEMSIDNLIKKTNRDFIRLILQPGGSVGGVKENLAVYRALDDQYVESMIPLLEAGYIYKDIPGQQEKVTEGIDKPGFLKRSADWVKEKITPSKKEDDPLNILGL